MTLLLVRHGRTAANAAGELLGRRDPPLDGTGEAQAAALAEAVARRWSGAGGVLTVVTSPLQRARRTAEVIAAALGTEAAVDDRWIEMDYGDLDGTPVASVPAETWAQWRRDPSFAPPGGETLAAVRARVAGALGALLADDHPDRTTVVVSHVSPIKAAVAEVLGVGDAVTWRLFLSPASITEVGARPGGGAALLGFNGTAHLDAVVG